MKPFTLGFKLKSLRIRNFKDPLKEYNKPIKRMGERRGEKNWGKEGLLFLLFREVKRLSY